MSKNYSTNSTHRVGRDRAENYTNKCLLKKKYFQVASCQGCGGALDGVNKDSMSGMVKLFGRK